MTVKDRLLALCVVTGWGFNFVAIDIGLQHMPPFLLAALRFVLVALPGIFFVKPPAIPLRWLVFYALTMSFGQFSFLFFAIKSGMPAGLASLLLQVQAFFTLLLGALCMAEKLKIHHLAGILIAIVGIVLLFPASQQVQAASGISLITVSLTLAAAFCWSMGNIANKIIMRDQPQMSILSLVIWSALVPIIPLLLCSWWFEGGSVLLSSLRQINLPVILVLLYLAYVASIMGYGLWARLLSRYETWRVAPLSLLVPVVGIISAALLLKERFTLQQMTGMLIVISGLLLNVFGSRCLHWLRQRGGRN